MGETRQAEFDSASRWLSSTPSAAGLPNDAKLELYGLFKYVTTHGGPSGSRPSMFSPAPRAKYDAWANQYRKYSGSDAGEARARYVSMAKEIGWDGHVDEEGDEEVDLERLDDIEDFSGRKVGTGENAMGGVKVSVMSGEVEGLQDQASPIHEAVLSNRTQQVRDVLGQDRSLVDLRDEYGYTPLHLAADRGFLEVVQVLLEFGAIDGLQDEDGQTALELAETSGRADIVTLLKR